MAKDQQNRGLDKVTDYAEDIEINAAVSKPMLTHDATKRSKTTPMKELVETSTLSSTLSSTPVKTKSPSID